MKVGILWKHDSLGDYSLRDTEKLTAAVGGNSGNIAFVYAIKNSLANEMRHYAWHTHPDVLKRECDIIVIPCANQLGKHTDFGDLAGRLRKSERPIVAIGLGAQANNLGDKVEISDGTIDWARAIHENRPTPNHSNIYTRGPFTTDVLASIGVPDAFTGGCPSHFINKRIDLGQSIQDRWDSLFLPRSISVAAGHQAWVKFTDIEHQLATLISDDIYPGQYVVQSALEMIRISRNDFLGIEESLLVKIKNYILPHYSLDEFKAWCSRYAKSFYDVPSWMDSLRRYDLVIGQRYHGVALGLQTGVMGLTVTIDSRTQELCEQTGVPYVDARTLTGPITRARLKRNIIHFDGAAYDRHRVLKAANFVTFLQNNGLTPTSELLALSSADKAS